MSHPEFHLVACGQQWRVRLLTACSLMPRKDTSDVWRAEIGDVFLEVPYIAGEPRAALERRLRAAVGGPAYRAVG